MNHRPYPAQPRRAPLALIVCAVILALLLAAAVLAWLAWQWHTLELSAPLVAAWLRYAVFTLPVAFAAWYAGLGLLGLYHRWASKHAAFADKTVALTLAQRSQGLPAQISSLSYHDSHRNDLAAPAQLALPAPEVVIAVPTFAQLLDSGAVAAGRDLVLAYGDAGAITGDWKRLYSAAIGGLQGSGKSWTASYLLAQSAIHGAKLVICDPHAGDSESLANRAGALAPSFLCAIADDDKTILAALQLADDVLQRRKKGDADRTPLIVAVDEWSSLRRGKLADLLPKLIEDFSTEGRKLNCHILLMAQRWDKASVGDFRNTLASAYIHRLRPSEARMLSGLSAALLPDDTLSLAPGQCYMLDTFGQVQRVAIPQMTPADMVRVGQMLGANAPQSAPGARLQMGFKPPQSAIKTQPLCNQGNPIATPTQSPERARILALFLDGKTIAEIVKEVYGVSSGAAYTARRGEVEQIVRDAARLSMRGVK